MKIIGIAGGTASGKTTIANKLGDLSNQFGQVNIIRLDDYYLDHPELDLEERRKINYDHPNAFDTDLLVKHIGDLNKNQSIDVPEYDFVNHARKISTKKVQPSKVLIIEGILVLAIKEICDLLDIKIFVDTPDDIRFIRRLSRDVKKRNRTLDNVIDQYLTTVRPMHKVFVEPSKENADLIIPEGGHNSIAIEMVFKTIIDLLNK
ncbi:MAG: uridine kinase [Candidatus Izemoplasmatales bacterium]|uniref:Uridine kinase n=1 Tax=Hujiaoplasma nucleasis TaxID=2725268 RepID=A0A7L6N3Q2_9MOLU|nr:uridine kinase [Hujiaoplasma nucleasis]QLY39867.1 uridine kinase [Hujiaoplasma nucleasis]